MKKLKLRRQLSEGWPCLQRLLGSFGIWFFAQQSATRLVFYGGISACWFKPFRPYTDFYGCYLCKVTKNLWDDNRLYCKT